MQPNDVAVRETGPGTEREPQWHTITLTFVPGTLTISRGCVAGADTRLRGRPEDWLQRATVPLRQGLPDAFNAPGRALPGSGSRFHRGRA